jgi:hypothetical protein
MEIETIEINCLEAEIEEINNACERAASVSVRKPNNLYVIAERNLNLDVNNIVVDKSSELIHVNMKINVGHNTIVNALCLWDNASTVCAISKEFALNNKIYINPADCTVTTINGKSKVLGITGLFNTIMYNHYECGVYFYILESSKHDVILGTNYQKAMNAGAVFENGEAYLIFNNRKFSVDSSFDSNFFIEEEEENNDIDISTIDNVDDDDMETDFDLPILTKSIEIKPKINLNESDQEKFNQVKQKIKSVVATNAKELGQTTAGEHKITLIDPKPVFVPPYRKSAAEQAIIQKETSTLYEANLIRKSRSAYCAPVIIVKKKGGQPRMVLNYKKLNSVMKTEIWPLPRIDDILEKLAQSTIFSKIDLKSGFHQIPLAEESKQYTSFLTPDGAYEFNVCPFGLKNMPFEFSRIMQKVLGDLPYVSIFIDDITVHSQNLNQHFYHLKTVIQRLVDANLKINIEKCTFIADEISILGHVIKNKQIKMDQEKIEAVKNRLPPTNIKQLQSFIGLCNYYRRFVKSYAHIVKPMLNLLRIDTPFIWDNECQVAFDKIKHKLTSYPILVAPDLTKTFRLYTDASGYAIGAVLTQLNDDGNEVVIAYWGRIQKRNELQFGISEKECLSLVSAIKHFRPYLAYTKFFVITDHAALRWLASIRDPTGRLARWSIYLQAYDFEILHRAGKLHCNADALSRPVLSSISNNTNDNGENINTISTVDNEIINLERNDNNFDNDDETIDSDPYENQHLMHYFKFGRHPSGASKNSIKKTTRLLKKFKYIGSHLHYLFKNNYVIYAKKEERELIIAQQHNLGHFKAHQTYKKIITSYYWKNILNDIIKFISKCSICIRADTIRPIHHTALATDVTGIFDQCAIDLSFGYPTTVEGFKGILVIIEYLSGFIMIYPIKSKCADEISKNLINYISIFSPPKKILSDLGTEFNNNLVDSLLNNLKIDHAVTAAYNPSTNGKVEKANHTIGTCMRKHADGNVSNWPEFIPSVQLAYNSKIHTSTGYTPFELVYGRKMNEFTNWQNKPTKEDLLALQSRSEEIQQLINIKQPTALVKINEKQITQKINQDKRNLVTTKDLEPGTKVVIKKEGLLKKLDQRSKGPFIVEQKTTNHNYQLRSLKTNEEKTIPRHKIHPIPNDLHFDDRTTTKRRGRSNAQINSIIVSLILFSWLLAMINGEAIEGKFTYCNTEDDSLRYWSNDLTCKKNNLKLLGNKKTFTMLNKGHDHVNGAGIECAIYKTTSKYYQTFFGQEIETSFTEVNLVKRDECIQMSKDKLCKDKQMTCNGANCYYKSTRKPVYKWLTTLEVIDHSCYVSNKIIIAANETSRLFDSKCIATDLECTLEEKIIVWSKDIIHQCPFNNHNTYEFEIYEDILINKNNRLLFQINEKIRVCDVDMYTTTEGVYLVLESNENDIKLKGLPIKMDSEAIKDFQLADEDYEYYLNAKGIKKLERETCLLWLSQLKKFESETNSFMSLFDNYGNELILYNNKISIAIPTCITINKLETITTNQCYKDIPFQIQLNGRNIIVYMNNDKILVRTSDTIPCDSNKRTMYLAKNDIDINYNKNKVQIENIKRSKIELNLKTLNLDKLNFQHTPLLTDSLDSVDLSETRIISEMTNIAFVDNEYDKFNLKQNQTTSYIYPIILTVLAVLIILGISFYYKSAKILSFFSKFYNSYFRKQQNHAKNTSVVYTATDETNEKIFPDLNEIKENETCIIKLRKTSETD